jgi:hypothetical protein
MNDFTKDELLALKLCIEDENLIGWTASHYEDLCRKIEAMIDNYCEHEWINSTYCGKCEKGIAEC